MSNFESVLCVGRSISLCRNSKLGFRAKILLDPASTSNRKPGERISRLLQSLRIMILRPRSPPSRVGEISKLVFFPRRLYPPAGDIIERIKQKIAYPSVMLVSDFPWYESVLSTYCDVGQFRLRRLVKMTEVERSQAINFCAKVRARDEPQESQGHVIGITRLGGIKRKVIQL